MTCGIELIEKITVLPENPTKRRRIFLSNIDLGLVAFQEFVVFFDPPQHTINFSDCCDRLKRALEKLLVIYDSFAGRLVSSLEDSRRLEIDCNGRGAVFAAARIGCSLEQLGNFMVPTPEFGQFLEFLRDEDEEKMTGINELPLLFIQLTQLNCGSLVFASRYNHCVLDGRAVREFEANLAALTRGQDLVVMPNHDRTILKARIPPRINHPHHEYSKLQIDPPATLINSHLLHSRRFTDANSPPNRRTRVVYLPPDRIKNLKTAALRDGKFRSCNTFEIVAARIWKARSIAMETDDEKTSKILFPVDIRKRIIPEAPPGFAGNAVIPGYAMATIRELREEKDYVLVKRVREGIERLDDEYVRSSIDWLELNSGVHWQKDTFSLVAWWRLGLEEEEFVWGKIKCSIPICEREDLVFLLPGMGGGEGLNVCIVMAEEQIEVFEKLMMTEG